MKLGTATTLADGKLTYHNTVVCEDLGDGRTRLNSGGFRTATTKRRMNEYAEAMGCEWRIFQRDYNWFISRHDLDTDTIEFHDGIEVKR